MDELRRGWTYWFVLRLWLFLECVSERLDLRVKVVGVMGWY